MKLTKFTAGLVALSLATAGISAVPARASDEDVALALGGLLTLFVIGKAIEDGKATSPSQSSSASDEGLKRGHGRDWDHGRRWDRYSSFDIPNQCVMTVSHGSRQRLVALADCVRKTRHTKAALPRACETRVRLRGHRADAYDLGCLSNFGYRVTRGRSQWDRDWGRTARGRE